MMFKKIFAIILFAGLILPIFTFAQNEQEKIDNYEISIKINSDSSINVSEKIYYNFGTIEKHGIYRDIPIKYDARGGKYKLDISEISIVDENNSPYVFKKSYEGSDLRLKIGESDKFVTGLKIYIINYTVKGAINYFDDRDELYWNAIGAEWLVNIEKASAIVVLPYNVKADQAESKCYWGSYGSVTECTIQKNDDKINFESPYVLWPEKGITIVIGLPKGILIEPGIMDKIWKTIKDNLVLFLPVLVFIFMFFKWYKYGRDPKGRGTIIPQYEAPDNLSPAEISVILDNKFEKKGISSEIINLAVNGYLKIQRIEKKTFIIKSVDYNLIKLKEQDGLKNDFEKKIMEALFGRQEEIKLSDLKNKFYKELRVINNEIYDSVVDKGYFVKNPNKVRAMYISLAITALFMIYLFVNLFSFLGVIGIVSIVLSCIIVIIFGWFMPKRTKKGAIARENILGLKQYLSVAEKDRIKFHNAPEKNPEQFEKFLPFAMVLGVEKEWAKQFEGIYNQTPSWYEGNFSSGFNAIILANILNDFSSAAYSNLSSPPSSAARGGSGFSGGGIGGGFGGGGGGSW